MTNTHSNTPSPWFGYIGFLICMVLIMQILFVVIGTTAASHGWVRDYSRECRAKHGTPVVQWFPADVTCVSGHEIKLTGHP